MTTRLQAVNTLARWTQAGRWPDVKPGQVYDEPSDKTAADLIASGNAVASAAPVTYPGPAPMARGIPGFKRAVSN